MANSPRRSEPGFSTGEGFGNAGTDADFAGQENRTMSTIPDPKRMAKAIRVALSERGIELKHAEALELVARQWGEPNWNVLSAKRGRESQPDGIAFEQAVPIVRIFDVARAHDFYLGFLGFQVDWEHRFGDNFPLYCQVSRGGLRLHLSEHSGDASPGGNMCVHMTGVRAFHAELAAKDYRYMKPGLESQEWGLEMQVTDPFSNRIRFMEPPRD